ncbi:MAG: glutamine--fructose-6-phosphate transaminase (isomerizing) [Rickettsiales bacterium]|nr:glutamine--fructose-6-phosphate transaminase (isomerizing) [Rickettsiales bacterium]OUV53389.1 MAG: glutamine--fructose-6-phosphate transaminase (isomerizing) [Rickettsiales bacterium TMED127]
MCGIFGVIGRDSVVEEVVLGLSKLEYRGYDSSGLSYIDNNTIHTYRAQGKLINLKKNIQNKVLKGKIAIGHTRWATHGIPSEKNAHPHSTENVSIVHNGIIENFLDLKTRLYNKGYNFSSQTDSEVIAHLITDYLKKGLSPEESVKKTLPELEGAFAVAVIFQGYNILIGARKGSPLAFGITDNKFYLGSDSLALAPFTQKVCFLEEGDWIVIKEKTSQIYDQNNKKVTRGITFTSYSGEGIGKGNFNHYMQKEIFEQPSVLGDSLSRFIDPIKKTINMESLKISWQEINQIDLVACGTSFYACLTATYWFQKYTGISCHAELASEFRYKEAIFNKNKLTIFISQSGETADSLAALRYIKSKKMRVLSIVNSKESSMARESDEFILIAAGPEIGVASTKALTAQLSILACLTIIISKKRKLLSVNKEQDMTTSLIELPSKITEILKNVEQIKTIAKKIVNSSSAIFLGRGSCFPIAMEGALKLKEISYIHAEGYASGEMKHGPIALIDKNMPVIIIAPKDELFDKNMSNTQEIVARGGKVFLLTDYSGAEELKNLSDQVISIPKVNNFVLPILYCVPVQLLAYFTAILKGTDVDQPRNLAKSVTVE